MNKKTIGLLLILGLTAALTACGGGGDTTAPAGGESPSMSPSASPSS